MTIVNTLDEVSAWLSEHVCQRVKFKPRSLDQQTADYDYELMHPSVFALYVPTVDTKPPDVKATSPAICVQMIEGTDSHTERELKLRLAFSVWNPGIHGPDVFEPTKDQSGAGRVYKRRQSAKLIRSNDGWRDVWNFVDVALREIENARSIAGRLVSSDIRYGPFDDDGSIPDYYPFWFAWVELSLREHVITDNPAIGDLL